MKLDIRRLFSRSDGRQSENPSGSYLDDGGDTNYLPVDAMEGEGLETDYQTLIAAQFSRWGISNECVTIEVRKFGKSVDGYDTFVGMVRLQRWERTSSMRLLLGLPLLESKIRKTVRASWLADYSHFAGLWLHVSDRLQVPDELRELMGNLVPWHAGGEDSRPTSL